MSMREHEKSGAHNQALKPPPQCNAPEAYCILLRPLQLRASFFFLMVQSAWINPRFGVLGEGCGWVGGLVGRGADSEESKRMYLRLFFDKSLQKKLGAHVCMERAYGIANGMA